MAVDWPSTLPQEFQQSGFSDTPQSGVIRTNMDTGFPKVRRRFTAITRTYKGTMILTDAQRQIFETFFETDLAYGSIRVNFPDPYNPPNPTPNLVEMRWVVDKKAPYSIAPNGATLDWQISFSLERLP